MRLALITLLLCAPAAFALPSNCTTGTNVYYIDNVSGLDSHTQTQAKSKSTPWAHQPYQASFTGSYAHTAGDCFVFKGGDTWNVGTTDYFNISTGGTSSGADYYGVDQTWFTGASWNRPIFDVQGDLPNVSSDASKIFNMTGSSGWNTFDNFEVIHGTCSSTGPKAQYYFPVNGDGTSVTNSYFHAFETPSGGCGSGVTPDGNQIAVWIFEQVGVSSCDGSFDHNVIDGTDGTGAQGYEVIVSDPEECQSFAFNVMHDICSGIGGDFTLAHDNLIYNFGGYLSGKFDCETQGIHPHAIRSNNDLVAYNNVVHDVTDGSIVADPQNGCPSGGTYIVNNVVWDSDNPAGTGSGTYGIQLGDNGTTTGCAYIADNTIQCTGNDLCFRSENGLSQVTLQNEHHIAVSASAGDGGVCIGNSPFSGCGTATTFTYTAAQKLWQTASQATSAGYTISNGYAPTSITSPTVGIGGNLTSSWPGGVSANATSFACSQGTVSGVVQVVCPAITVNTRPGSGAWNVGAYEFNAASSAPPAPASNMFVMVK